MSGLYSALAAFVLTLHLLFLKFKPRYATVYPNISPAMLTMVGVAVCVRNLGLYGWMSYVHLKH
jgi:hypothetical protein